MRFAARYAQHHVRSTVLQGRCPWCPRQRAYRRLTAHVRIGHQITGGELRDLAGLGPPGAISAAEVRRRVDRQVRDRRKGRLKPH